MSRKESVLTAWEDKLTREIEDLRRDLFSMFVPGLLCLSVVWFYYSLVQTGTVHLWVAPTAILCLAALLAYGLSEKHYYVGAWVLLVGMILSEAAIVVVLTSPMVMALGIAVIIAASALLGTREAVLTALLTWALVWAARYVRTYDLEASRSYIADTLILYLFTTSVCWIANRPLRAALEWSLTGWVRAHDALTDARERRAELHRALRALEEATYRIERANNELVLAQREAEEARAIKARFVATVSHELRSPLNLILGFARLMALSPESYGEPLPRAYRGDMDTIYRNTQHLVSLVDDVLDLSQIETQHLPLVKDRIDLVEDVISKVADNLRPLAERKGLYVRTESPDQLPWVLADQVRLRQALLNMLTNAIRFTERGGITIRVSVETECILVGVQDTGPGIAPDDLPKLFKEFQQVQRTERREESGSGLGLAIAKHLVDLHGGGIWVESQPGVGTTFYFTVPLPNMQSYVPETISTESASRGRTHDVCLVVHDDPSIVRLLSRHIEGYRVVGIPHWKEAISLVERLHPKAILAGPGPAKQIREDLLNTTFDVPIVTCEMPRMCEAIELEDVVSYLVKPITPEVLDAAMRQLECDEEMTILVVDDDPDAVRLIERMLTAIPHSHTILKAYDGIQALEIMERVIPDVVLMDLMMPEPDGMQVIQRMRASERMCSVPVVIISALDWIEERTAVPGSLSIHHRGSLDIATWTRYLQALLDVLRPSYLAGPEASAPFVAASPGQWASGEHSPHQAHMPTEVH